MISIVLVNYNNSNDTICCLKSLFNQNFEDFEIIILDNNSRKNDKQLIIKYLKNNDIPTHLIKNIKFVSSSKNLGFTGGNNTAVKYAKGDIILLLNSDTVHEPDFLEIMYLFFRTNKSVHITQPKICFFNNKNLIWSNGGKINKFSPKLFSHLNYLELNNNQFVKPFKIDYAVGCAIFIRKEVIHKIGLFDNIFFMYCEESDFCYRATKAGYNIYINPNVTIYHKVDLSRSNTFKKFYFRNRNIWCIKNLPVLIVIWQFFMQFIHVIGLTKNLKSKKLDYKFFFQSIKGILLGLKIGFVTELNKLTRKKM